MHILTRAEITQANKFQDAIGEVVDQYLREGMDPDIMRKVLEDEASGDLAARRVELEDENG